MATEEFPSRDGPDAFNYDDYIVARLALWAGDTAEARRRLRIYRRGRRGTDDNSNFRVEAHECADRTLRQLNRRVSEYNTIYKTAGLNSSHSPTNILRSAAHHLGGVVWIETDREYELRAYLLDLSWEPTFYERAVRFVKDVETSRVLLNYRHETNQTAFPSGEDRELALGLEWVAHGEIFVQAYVSDLGTLSARGVWTVPDPPPNEGAIFSAFQQLLNKFDPV